MKFKKELYLLLLIIIIGLVLRIINIGSEPYWGDEVLSLGIVHHYENDIPGMLTYLRTVEVHPPLYYLGLHYWTDWFGYSETSTRSLSLIFGIGVILLTYLLGRKLFSARVGLLSAFLVAILPFQIEFSQEARPYIIYTFFGLLAVFFLWQYLITKKKINLLVYIICTLIGLFLHYSFFFIAISLGLFWLTVIKLWNKKDNKSRDMLYWLISHSIIFVIYYKQLVILLYKLLLSRYVIFGLGHSLDHDRKTSFFESVINQLIWTSKNEDISKIAVFSIFLFKLAFFISLFWLITHYQVRLKNFFVSQSNALFFVIWLAFLPLIFFLFTAFSLNYTSIYEKHVITSSIFLVIIIAYVIGRINFKIGFLLLSLFVISIVNSLCLIAGNDAIWDRQHRLKLIADHINNNYLKGDLLFVACSYTRSDLNHFLRPDIEAIGYFPITILDYQYDFLASRETLGLIENESQFRMPFPSDLTINKKKLVDNKLNYLIQRKQPTRIWLVQLDKEESILSWLRKNNWQEHIASVGDLFPVQLFVKK